MAATEWTSKSTKKKGCREMTIDGVVFWAAAEH